MQRLADVAVTKVPAGRFVVKMILSLPVVVSMIGPVVESVAPPLSLPGGWQVALLNFAVSTLVLPGSVREPCLPLTLLVPLVPLRRCCGLLTAVAMLLFLHATHLE